jgi:hypothetical protein
MGLLYIRPIKRLPRNFPVVPRRKTKRTDTTLRVLISVRFPYTARLTVNLNLALMQPPLRTLSTGHCRSLDWGSDASKLAQEPNPNSIEEAFERIRRREREAEERALQLRKAKTYDPNERLKEHVRRLVGRFSFKIQGLLWTKMKSPCCGGACHNQHTDCKFASLDHH